MCMENSITKWQRAFRVNVRATAETKSKINAIRKKNRHAVDSDADVVEWAVTNLYHLTRADTPDDKNPIAEV